MLIPNPLIELIRATEYTPPSITDDSQGIPYQPVWVELYRYNPSLHSTLNSIIEMVLSLLSN